jgi:hypothetical protein
MSNWRFHSRASCQKVGFGISSRIALATAFSLTFQTNKQSISFRLMERFDPVSYYTHGRNEKKLGPKNSIISAYASGRMCGKVKMYHFFLSSVLYV